MVDNPYSLNQTPIFELNVVRCGFKNAYQNDVCIQDIGLRAQNMISILGSIIKLLEGRPISPFKVDAPVTNHCKYH